MLITKTYNFMADIFLKNNAHWVAATFIEAAKFIASVAPC